MHLICMGMLLNSGMDPGFYKEGGGKRLPMSASLDEGTGDRHPVKLWNSMASGNLAGTKLSL